jgi:Mg/Co/Ni transporter MgtE
MNQEVPYLDDNPGNLRLDAFYARAVSEFDRRYAPGLKADVTGQFIDSVVRNAISKLTKDDLAEFLTEVPELLTAGLGRAMSKEEVTKTLNPISVKTLTDLLANDLQTKLRERVGIQALA